MNDASRSPLPGEELIRKGLADLERGLESEEALLVSIGAPRLRRLGFSVPEPIAGPEHRLYELLHAPRRRGALALQRPRPASRQLRAGRGKDWGAQLTATP